MKSKSLIILVLLATTAITMLQSSGLRTETEMVETKVFNIHDYSWLVGHWKGDGFGGVSEEVWTAPADGTMMGMYRHLMDRKLNFYEFLLLDQEGMKLKHFHPDLKGWETKDEYVTFPLVEFSKDKLVFKGLIFERKSDTEMEIRLRMRTGEEIITEVFHMKRVL